MTAENKAAQVDVAFLRDLAGRIFRHAAPIQGFDQGDVDRLYALAHRLAAVAEGKRIGEQGWEFACHAYRPGQRIVGIVIPDDDGPLLSPGQTKDALLSALSPPTEDLIKRITAILQADPVCGGRVTEDSVEMIAAIVGEAK